MSYGIDCSVVVVDESLVGHHHLLWLEVVLLMVAVELVLFVDGADLELQVAIEGFCIML